VLLTSYRFASRRIEIADNRFQAATFDEAGCVHQERGARRSEAVAAYAFGDLACDGSGSSWVAYAYRRFHGGRFAQRRGSRQVCSL